MAGQVLCPRGQVEDYDPATGQWLGTCVNDTQAYEQGPTYQPPRQGVPSQPAQGQPYNAGNLGTVNVSGGAPVSDNTILLIAGGVLLFFLMKRR